MPVAAALALWLCSGFAPRRRIDPLLTAQAALLPQGQRVDERLLSLHKDNVRKVCAGLGAGLEHVTAVLYSVATSSRFYVFFGRKPLLSG